MRAEVLCGDVSNIELITFSGFFFFKVSVLFLIILINYILAVSVGSLAGSEG